MDNRFINTDFFQAYRKLESRLKMLFLYGWLNADDCGVYEFDLDYVSVDLKDHNFTVKDFDSLPDVEKIADHKYLFTEFISVCYKSLKSDYNPHKPAFRALEKHGLNLNAMQNKAIFKLAASLLNGNENSNGNEKEKEGQASIKSKPNNAGEVIEYFKKLNILNPQPQAEKFYNFYEAKGWMIGKNKIKNWKACVKTWDLPKIASGVDVKPAQYSTHGQRTDLTK